MTPVILSENSMVRGVWRATVHGVKESATTEHTGTRSRSFGTECN